MASSPRQMRTIIGILVSLVLALLLSATTGVDLAQADEYTQEPFSCSSSAPTDPGDSASGSYDNNGNLYIPCGNPNTDASSIYKYDLQGNATKLIDVAYDVSDVAPSPTGSYLYLATGESTPIRLNRSDATGAYTVDEAWKIARYPMDASVGWYIHVPQGLYIDTDNSDNIYLSDGAWTPNGVHTVVKYGPDGGFLTRFGSKHTTWDLGYFYHQLNGIAVKGDGSKVYTVEGGNNRVQVWSRQGLNDNSPYSAVSSFGGNRDNNPDREGYCKEDGWQGAFASPYDIALDAGEQNLFVLNTTCHQVMKFTTSGAYTSAMRVGVDNATASNRPHGFAVAKNGNVYVGQSGKKMILANTDTTPPTSEVSPASGATGVDVASKVTATFKRFSEASRVDGGDGTSDTSADVLDFSWITQASVKGLGVFVSLSGISDGSGFEVTSAEVEDAVGSSLPDDMRGDNMRNTLYGGAGNDIIVGGTEAAGANGDRIYGEAGNDTIKIRDGAIDIVDCEENEGDADKVEADPNDTVNANCEERVDTTAPTAKAPTHSFTTASTLGASTVPVKLTWSATDNAGGSGIATSSSNRALTAELYQRRAAFGYGYHHLSFAYPRHQHLPEVSRAYPEFADEKFLGLTGNSRQRRRDRTRTW